MNRNTFWNKIQNFDKKAVKITQGGEGRPSATLWGQAVYIDDTLEDNILRLG